MKEYSLKETDIYFIGIYYQEQLLTFVIRAGELDNILNQVTYELRTQKLKHMKDFTSEELQWCYPKVVLTLNYEMCGNRYIINSRELEWITLSMIRTLQPKYITKGKDAPFKFSHDFPSLTMSHNSKQEMNVGIWLDAHNIEYESEFSYNDLRGDYEPLRFDYKIKNRNIVIEVQGEQHYDFCPHWHKTPYNFHKQVDYDMRKRAYCAKNTIWLIEIPYSCKNLDRYLLPILIEDENEELTHN